VHIPVEKIQLHIMQISIKALWLFYYTYSKSIYFVLDPPNEHGKEGEI